MENNNNNNLQQSFTPANGCGSTSYPYNGWTPGTVLSLGVSGPTSAERAEVVLACLLRAVDAGIIVTMGLASDRDAREVRISSTVSEEQTISVLAFPHDDSATFEQVVDQLYQQLATVRGRELR
jgi:hypothetical protein